MDQATAVTYARKQLEDILSFFEVNVTVEAVVSEQVIELSVPSTDLNSLLIGRNAETLRALQYLVSTTLRNKQAALTRVNIDIADYKKQRADKVAARARQWIDQVQRTGQPERVRLNPADRRVVHRVAAEYADIDTHSEGEGSHRQIVISRR